MFVPIPRTPTDFHLRDSRRTALAVPPVRRPARRPFPADLRPAQPSLPAVCAGLVGPGATPQPSPRRWRPGSASLGATVVLSPALGGIVIGHEMGRALGVRAIFAERQDGRLTLRRGFTLAPDDRVLVVEDVVTTGGSTRETMEVAREAGRHGRRRGVDRGPKRRQHRSRRPVSRAAADGGAHLRPGGVSVVRRGRAGGEAGKPRRRGRGTIRLRHCPLTVVAVSELPCVL